MNLPQKFRSVLEHRRLPLLAGVLAVVFTLPALGSGLQFDDLFHRFALLGRPEFEAMGAPGHLFSFVDGNPARTRHLMDLGVAPWWTAEDLRASFWRPLSELTHRVDYALWPNHPALMHVQSLLWYGALAAAAALLYRRLMGAGWVAGLAGLLYALDDSHGSNAGWVANRNSLLAALFGVLALVAHDVWRRDGRTIAAVAACVALAFGLLSAEAAIAIGAYLVSYCLFLDPARWRARLASLVPYGIVTAVWWVVHHHLGFVIRGTGVYFDPGADPAGFVRALSERAPVMLFGQWTPFPPSIHLFLTPPATRALWLVAAASLLVLAVPMWRVVRRDATALFWAVGMLLAVVPACATFPHERLLLFAGLGGMGLVALFLREYLFTDAASSSPMRSAHAAPTRWGRAAAWFLIVTHCVLGPLALPAATWSVALAATKVATLMEGIPADDSVGEKDFIIVATTIPYVACYLPIVRASRDLPVPRRLRVLASNVTQVEISRPDGRSLLIRPSGGFEQAPLDRLFRGVSRPMVAGQRVVLSGMTVEVTRVSADGIPAEAVFHFGASLEDPSFVWMVSEDGVLKPFVPPPVGGSQTLLAQDAWK